MSADSAKGYIGRRTALRTWRCAGGTERRKGEGAVKSKLPASVTLLKPPTPSLPNSWVNQMGVLFKLSTAGFHVLMAKIFRCNICEWQCFVFTGGVLQSQPKTNPQSCLFQ